MPIVQVERDGNIITDDVNGVYRDVASFSPSQIVTYRVRSTNGTLTSDWSAPITITVNS